MSASEFTLPKDDNASVSSAMTMVDSSYGSLQGASRRGTQAGSLQETRSQVEEQFFYSPTLSSDTFSSLPGQHTDMNQMFLPAASGEAEIGDSQFTYANYPSAQSYGQLAQNWTAPDAQLYNSTFNLNQMRQRQPFVYSSQESSEFGFSPMLQAQRPFRKPQIHTARSSSSVTAEQHEARNVSTNDAAFASFVMSPASSVMNVTRQANVSDDFAEPQHYMESNVEDETTRPRSLVDELDEELLSPTQAARAQHEEAQGRVARTDPLYQAQPGLDDLYHCPNEGQPGCNHKPTKLKCNYDKYVDSHLRPFRCKDKACVGVQFSSTACLLRHEREAHGLHGHGSKPHLCTYPDCERSVIGNGFPRRYNLFDHMKRVHDYTPSTSPSELSPGQQPQPDSKRPPRKRKSTADENAEKRQKTTKANAQALAIQNQLILRRKQLQAEFHKLRESIVRTLTDVQDPKELNGLQLTEEAVALQKVSAQLKGLG
ncbi:hypothetical protein GQ43DRAFT_31365 [Delitschia confertaspora ATCC 74209]|uniref:C2H2-type domain-containing protein n=1 Tax=Delitschia confertaspora ATCC 74209 TaxID=1513339 RepID=A0A9P4JLE8_9PLEO|nr:hypothetical protein GQ43DRAFT_31365 [Delitschia confertaspora ATCC 74209]